MRERRAEPETADKSAVQSSAPGVVIWGRMCAAEKRLRAEFAHLPDAALDYHGTLRTSLSAALSIVDDIKLLLKMLDEKGEF